MPCPHPVRHVCAAAIMFTAMVLNAAYSDIINVPADQPTIQAAIDVSVDGDTVIIADGTYTGDGNLDLDFGGRAITVRSANGPDNCVIDGENGSHRGFHFSSAEGSDSVVQGLTITNGGAGPVHPNGGGIRCDGASPRIVGNVFIDNGDYMWNGGGIYCANSSAEITGNTFVDHMMEEGGGIYSTDSDLVITGNTFTGNFGNPGSGIYCIGGAPLIAFNYFYDNFGEYGGAISCFRADPVIVGNLITGGNCGGYGWGCGILITMSSAVIMDNIIDNNQTNGYGGGIAIRYWTAGDQVLLINNQITNNEAMYGGGGVFTWDAAATIESCTITGNVIGHSDQPGIGGGMLSYDSAVTIGNSIIRDNMTWEGIPDQIHVETGGAPLVSYSNVEGGYAGTGNLDADPLFVGGPMGEYYLSQVAAGQATDSPCLDAGSDPADSLCVTTAFDSFCLDERTTRSDHQVMDSGTVDIGFHYRQALFSSVSAELACSPATGTLPFTALVTAGVTNTCTNQVRRVAMRIDAELANGQQYTGWKSGWTNILAGATFNRSWNQPLPNLPKLVGSNIFTLRVEDVTPAPFNQPPYPPSGDTDRGDCTVMGVAP